MCQAMHLASGAAPLKLECLCRQPGDVVPAQLLTQEVWGEARESAFLAGSPWILSLCATEGILAGESVDCC